MSYKGNRRKIRELAASVSVKVLLIMSLLVLPLNIIAIIYTNKAADTIIKQAEYSIQKITDLQVQEMENRMDNARTLLTYFSSDDVDYMKLKRKESEGYEREAAKMKLYVKLRTMAEMTDGGDGYFFYYPDRTEGVIYGNPDKKSEMINQTREFLEHYSQDENPKGWRIYEWNGKSYLILVVQDGKVLCGSMIRLEPFMQMVVSGIEYPVEEITVAENMEEEQKNRFLFVRADGSRIDIGIKVDKTDILRGISFLQRYIWVLAVSYLMLIPVLYIVLKKLLIHPLLEVNEAHRQVEEGNGGYRIQEEPSTTEYKELYASFNRMADNLYRLKIETYEQEIFRQKMELRNLQLQIRPHFLLNTFNLIFSLAQRNENGMVQETIIYLSDYFRYIFRSEKELELFQKELHIIKGYIQIAALRYSGRVKAEYEIEPELDLVRLPPLLLHNFVENAVKYGIKNKELLHIRIEGTYDNGIVHFMIEDDGKGMSPEELEKNRRMFAGKYKPKDGTEHLGLYNSMKRLTYFYGKDACIDVMSELGQGTCFKISFPYAMEVEDEFADSE